MLRASLAAVLLLLTPLAACVDAAAGGGSSQATAALIGEGTHQGSANEDEGVWYRVGVPEGKAVDVSFTVVSGDTWNDLLLVDSTGAQMVWVRHGRTGAYDPDEADAWIRIESFWGPLDYSFTVSFFEAPAQDDAGSGQDAGQRQATALDIQPGLVKGRVREAFGDAADWYRLAVPAGTILDFHSSTGASVYLVSAEGVSFGRLGYFDSPVYSLVAGDEPIFILVDYGDLYSFVVDASRRSDLRVDAVEVREVEIQTDSGPAGAAYARQVLVTVSNVGEGHSRKASLLVRSTHEGPATGSRVIGERALDLEPGQQTTIALPWDTTGQVGDAAVVATATSEFDVDPRNDAGQASSFVLAGGLPMGLDLLNHEARAAGVTLRSEYGGDRVGVAGPVGFVGYSRGVLTLP